jgi:transcriptional antiterminator RfaH
MLHHVIRPLFPRYLFLQFDHLAESWSPVRATPGVLDLIRSGSELHYANAGAVEALEATQDARRSQPPEISQWASGAPCALRYGPCAGLPAVITAVTRETATIAIMMLGHLRNVSVPLDCLAPRGDT